MTPQDRLAALHRYAFVLPLCPGRVVADAGPDEPEGRAMLQAAAARLVAAAEGGAAELIVSLAPARAAVVVGSLGPLLRRLVAGGVLVVAVSDDPAAAESALAGVFRHVRAYRQRRLAGSLIVEAALAASRVVALAGAPADQPAEVTLLLAAAAPLPPLPTGVLEHPAPPPFRPAPATLSAPSPAAGGDAAALVDRLVALDERAIELEAMATRLRLQADSSGTGQGSGAFDVPRTAFAWPLIDMPDRGRETLTFYEHRPDDDLVSEARAGDAFLRRFGLLGDAADFDGAVAALNRLARPPRAAAPEVSIIIPVYGQLGYTLNCLHSLLGQATRHAVEIIVADDASADATAAVVARIDGVVCRTNQRNLGFLRTCNAAAATARGRFLVLLNNDTRVLPGWLDALIASFAQFPRAGLVGAKLLYPDGALQEAGAIIWHDGSAWNYGRNDDPNRPHYSHAREVDYVSAAAVALPRAVWQQVGGFDPHFAPAYAEDSDLCLRLAAAGHEVWYQPTARVIHYEGRTSGTDTTQGIKAHQTTNAAKLFLRWRDRLAAHRRNGEAPYFERDRNVTRRALIVDATTPTPRQDAGSVTTTLTLTLFRRLGYKAYFTPQDNFLFEPEHTPALQALGVECAYAPYDTEFDAYIRRYGALFDVVLVYRVPVLERVIDALHRFAPQAPVLFHIMDLHFLRLEREAAVSGTAAAAEAAARMKAKELALIRRADCTITHSTYERDLLAAAAPEAAAVVWPFMFEYFGTTRGFAERRDFVFLGGYRHPPNVDAVQFFAGEVLRLIRARAPDARFIIAGANPGPEVQALAGPDVVVTGMVEDLRDVFDPARVFVCPLRFGAGTKGKISTAMAYGMPVVSTSCGAEGMELIEGDEVLIADDPQALADACLRVYHDAALWSRLSQGGQKLVQAKHSLTAGERILAQAIETGWRHKLGL